MQGLGKRGPAGERGKGEGGKLGIAPSYYLEKGRGENKRVWWRGTAWQKKTSRCCPHCKGTLGGCV